VGRLPLPAVSADPDVIAAERRPDPVALRSVAARADEIMVGCLGGVAAGALVCVSVLAFAEDVSSGLLAGVASLALLLRSRLFPSVRARSPLLASGALGLAVTGWGRLPGAGPGVLLVAFGVGAVAVAVLGLFGFARNLAAG
jgi:hypothetical protein